MRPITILSLLSALLLGACTSMPTATPSATVAVGRRISAPLNFERGCETAVLVCGAAKQVATQPTEASPPEGVLALPPKVEGKEGVALLKVVNSHVNGSIRPTADTTVFGAPDGWNRPALTRMGYVGDCKNFAVEKRAELVAAGFDEEALSYAVVYRRDIGLHAVLVATVEGVDYVLDNRSPYVLPWHFAPYVWVKRQSVSSLTGWRQVLASGVSSTPTLQLALLDR